MHDGVLPICALFGLGEDLLAAFALIVGEEFGLRDDCGLVGEELMLNIAVKVLLRSWWTLQHRLYRAINIR